MKIAIKNMVSTRCLMAVEAVLEDIGIKYSYVELGEVETSSEIPDDMIRILGEKLRPLGLELKENKKFQLVESIKVAIMELIHNPDDQRLTLSEYLSRKLGHNSTYLSNLFSEVQGVSIEKFFISKKIEHVKELLINEKLNLKEISYLTNYSSVAHLSYQFKKITGIAPSEFRLMLSKNSMTLQEALY
jgi:AraC-like DNA-binding protein